MATMSTKRSSAGKPTIQKTQTRPKATTNVPAKAKQVKPVNTPEPVVVTATPVVSEPDLRKKELIDLVVERSGIKKKDAKPVVEAMLAVLGETIGAGRELNLQPLGKLRINRSEERSNGRIIVCKLRQNAAATENSLMADKSSDSPLAEGKC